MATRRENGGIDDRARECPYKLQKDQKEKIESRGKRRRMDLCQNVGMVDITLKLLRFRGAALFFVAAPCGLERDF